MYPTYKKPLLVQYDMAVPLRTTGDADGKPSAFGTDLMFWLFDCPAWKFLVFVLLTWMSLVTLFAALISLPIFMQGEDPEYAVSSEEPSTFYVCFLLSAQTLSTVGYGSLTPVSVWANAVSILENIIGFLYSVLIGGILFSRVSTHKTEIHLSNVAVVVTAGADGEPGSITLRMCNERPQSCLLDVSASMSILMKVGNNRRQVPLKLVREHEEIMRGSWQITHKFTADSPLCGLTRENVHEKLEGCLIVMVKGVDEKFLQPQHIHKVYYASDLRFDQPFKDVLDFDDDKGEIILHLENLHSVAGIVENKRRLLMAPLSQETSSQSSRTASLAQPLLL